MKVKVKLNFTVETPGNKELEEEPFKVNKQLPLFATSTARTLIRVAGQNGPTCFFKLVGSVQPDILIIVLDVLVPNKESDILDT